MLHLSINNITLFFFVILDVYGPYLWHHFSYIKGNTAQEVWVLLFESK